VAIEASRLNSMSASILDVETGNRGRWEVFQADFLGLPRGAVPDAGGAEVFWSRVVPVSSATREERRFAAVEREAASCVSNSSTKAISWSTLATIRFCSARGWDWQRQTFQCRLIDLRHAALVVVARDAHDVFGIGGGEVGIGVDQENKGPP
jgi:hypothetical protein